MEVFESIDWLPNVEDIIDDKFLDEERLKKEGAMYSLLNGTFEDPFADIRDPNYVPFKKQTPKKKNQNTGNNQALKKTNQNTGNNQAPKKTNQNTGNNEDTPKKQRGRPKKKKD